MENRRNLSRLSRFMRDFESFTDHQVEVLHVDKKSEWIIVRISPNDGPYRGVSYRFKIWMTHKPPEVLDKIFHPNMSELDRFVCVEYDSGIDHPLLAVLFLLHHPNYAEPYCHYDHWKNKSPREAYRSVRLSLTGRPVDDFLGDRLIEDDEEIVQFLNELWEEELMKQREWFTVDDHRVWMRAECEELRARREDTDNLLRRLREADEEAVLEHVGGLFIGEET